MESPKGSLLSSAVPGNVYENAQPYTVNTAGKVANSKGGPVVVRRSNPKIVSIVRKQTEPSDTNTSNLSFTITPDNTLIPNNRRSSVSNSILDAELLGVTPINQELISSNDTVTLQNHMLGNASSTATSRNLSRIEDSGAPSQANINSYLQVYSDNNTQALNRSNMFNSKSSGSSSSSSSSSSISNNINKSNKTSNKSVLTTRGGSGGEKKLVPIRTISGRGNPSHTISHLSNSPITNTRTVNLLDSNSSVLINNNNKDIMFNGNSAVSRKRPQDELESQSSHPTIKVIKRHNTAPSAPAVTGSAINNNNSLTQSAAAPIALPTASLSSELVPAFNTK